jgi:DNA-binding NarL/FixJ family response regulator
VSISMDGSKALVVDADPTWARVVERGLIAHGVRKVLTVPSFPVAKACIEGGEDIVVTEVVIAQASCLEFLEHIRAKTRVRYVVAMSAHAPRPQVFRLRDLGAHAYLEKPFSDTTLRRCLERLDQPPHDGFGPSQVVSVPTPTGEKGPIDLAVEVVRRRFHLTDAETEILRCCVRGMNRAEVAQRRATSLNTVKTQIRSLLSKSGAESLRALVLETRRAYSQL